MLHPARVFARSSGGGLRRSPVEALRSAGARSLSVHLIALQPARGLLRLQAHREDDIPDLHVLRRCFLYRSQSAGAQSPGLEEDQAGGATERGDVLAGLRRDKTRI